MLAVYSREEPALALVAVREGGQLKLDVRGLERAEFVHACAAAGALSAATCGCAFDRARAEGQLTDGVLDGASLAALREDARECGAPAAALGNSPGARTGLSQSTPP